MIEYYCESCDSLIDKSLIDKNTNKCMICKDKYERLKLEIRSSSNIEDRKLLNTERVKLNNSYIRLKTKLFWCDECNVPLSDEKCSRCGIEGKYIGTDLRPVFPEEQLLLNIVSSGKFPIDGKSVWYLSSNRYVIDGQVIDFKRTDYISDEVSEIINTFYGRLSEVNYSHFNDALKTTIEVNRGHINEMTSESYFHIKESAKKFQDDEMFISFSGGKDSTAVDELVKRALPNRNIVKIFGDTTLEFPMTYDYVKRVKENVYNQEHSPMLVAKNRKEDFYHLCEKVGPPSRVLRWCCTYFKTTPISDKIDSSFRNKKRILTFYGIRRNESISRSKYDMQSESPKISKQIVFSPVIDWLDFDIWLYILSLDCDFNDAYRYGYSRVGCWCCPNNNDWSMFLSKILMTDLSLKWRKILYDFAIKTMKEDPEGYVKDNYWKARQGGNGLEISNNTLVEFTPCVTEPDTYIYQLTRPVDESIYELFRPFGYIDTFLGNKKRGEVFIISRDETPVLRLQGKEGTTTLKITVIDYKKLGNISKKIRNVEEAKKKIDCQIVKFQTCIICNGCKSACRFDAIKIENLLEDIDYNGNIVNHVQYKIDDSKCVRCGECIDHFDGGCYMKKVLRVKREQ